MALLLANPPLIAQYKLVWSDEFNVDGAPDSTTWSPELGFVRNNEFQWFQLANAYCKDGKLIIEAKKEKVANRHYKPGSPNWKEKRATAEYTSASIVTAKKRSWQYGRFEMKAKIDIRAGLWPAFWTLGANNEWPENGEIDIMEFYRDTLLANACWGGNQPYKATWSTTKKPVSELGGAQWAEKFHIWRMDWDEKSIKLYVDDILLNTIDLEKTINPREPAFHPFRQPHYLLLTLAIGGDNGGDPSLTIFPARFEVDYVRVYQK
jgi:beta-glucanase (GH16 family)